MPTMTTTTKDAASARDTYLRAEDDLAARKAELARAYLNHQSATAAYQSAKHVVKLAEEAYLKAKQSIE